MKKSPKSPRESALEQLGKLMEDPDVDPNVRLSAAATILNHAFEDHVNLTQLKVRLDRLEALSRGR